MTTTDDMVTAPEERGTLIAAVVQRLRNAIVGGELPPGSRLVISDLALRFGVGPTPVREALRWLEGEGLLVGEPNRGVTVRKLDAEFIRQVYEIRAVLEAFLVRRAVEQMTFEHLAEIEQRRLTFEEAAARGDRLAMLRANTEFHGAINQCANNEEAIRVLERGWQLVHAFRHQLGFGERRVSMIIEEHRCLVATLRDCDAERAVVIIRMHTNAARDDLLQMIV